MCEVQAFIRCIFHKNTTKNKGTLMEKIKTENIKNLRHGKRYHQKNLQLDSVS